MENSKNYGEKISAIYRQDGSKIEIGIIYRRKEYGKMLILSPGENGLTFSQTLEELVDSTGTEIILDEKPISYNELIKEINGLTGIFRSEIDLQEFENSLIESFAKQLEKNL